MAQYGHSAVIVFFVLSGFVIAHVVDTKEVTWLDYGASRLARLYSVALPAVVATIVLDSIGRQLRPEIYHYPFDQFGVRVVSGLLFLNEAWFISITSFSNVPYWSVCYEAWYYVAFGVLKFAAPRWRWPLLLGIALLLGPKWLLLAPVWLAGAQLYRWKRLRSIRIGPACALAVISLVGIVVFHAWDLDVPINAVTKAGLGEAGYKQLTFSKFFLSDYLLALLVFVHLAAMRVVAPLAQSWWLWLERPIRMAAGYTFTLYLFHQPLFLIWGSLVRRPPTGYGYWLTVTAVVAPSIWLIGQFTEHRRHVLRTRIQTALGRWQAGSTGKVA